MKKFFLAALACFALSAQAAHTEMSQENLLKGYWGCIQVSDETEGTGTKPFPSTLLDTCSVISKEVQDRYFGGDFGKLFDWTKQNRKTKPLVVK